MGTVLIVHDGRIFSLVVAYVLRNVYGRDGWNVLFDGSAAYIETSEIWELRVGNVSGELYDRVIIAGITFNETAREQCERILQELADSTEVHVWTYRWPDGYENVNCVEVFVPQFDLHGPWRNRISESERSLLRLVEIGYKDLPRGQAAPEDLRKAIALRQWFYENRASLVERLNEEKWDLLITDLAERVDEAAEPLLLGAIGPLHMMSPVVSLDLNEHALNQEEAAIGFFAQSQELDEDVVVVALAEYREEPRIYLARPLASGIRPSIEWLVHETNDIDIRVVSEGRVWAGPQDVRHLRFPAGANRESVLEARDRIVSFAARVADLQEGLRTPPVGIVRLLADAATRCLERIDLFGQYQANSDGLRFDATQTRMLVDRSNRNDALRATLILHLRAESLDAAAFLLSEGSRNLARLESLLEGALLSQEVSSGPWLGEFALALRLRLDVHISLPRSASALLGKMRAPSTVAYDLADLSSAIRPESRIGQGLRRHSVSKLVVYNQSETIGPSLPFAMLLVETARQIQSIRAEQRGSRNTIQALDLFAGSGVASKMLAREVPGARVFAVDLMIRGSDVEIYDFPSVTWLRADARIVVGKNGAVDRHFDIVGVDPPHRQLLEIVFAEYGQYGTLIDNLVEVADWVLMYVGHTAQAGRLDLVNSLLAERCPRLAWIRIGQEMLVLTGPEADSGVEFNDLVERILRVGGGRIVDNGWELARMDGYRAKSPRVQTYPVSGG